MKPYADVLIAWAQGKVVQWRNMDSEWWVAYMSDVPPPIHSGRQWQVKPEPKPDVVYYENVYPLVTGGTGYSTIEDAKSGASNRSIGILKITISGETGKVTAEVCE